MAAQLKAHLIYFPVLYWGFELNNFFCLIRLGLRTVDLHSRTFSAGFLCLAFAGSLWGALPAPAASAAEEPSGAVAQGLRGTDPTEMQDGAAALDPRPGHILAQPDPELRSQLLLDVAELCLSQPSPLPVANLLGEGEAAERTTSFAFPEEKTQGRVGLAVPSFDVVPRYEYAEINLTRQRDQVDPIAALVYRSRDVPIGPANWSQVFALATPVNSFDEAFLWSSTRLDWPITKQWMRTNRLSLRYRSRASRNKS